MGAATRAPAGDHVDAAFSVRRDPGAPAEWALVVEAVHLPSAAAAPARVHALEVCALPSPQLFVRPWTGRTVRPVATECLVDRVVLWVAVMPLRSGGRNRRRPRPLRGLVGRVPAVDPYAVSYDDSDSRAACLGFPLRSGGRNRRRPRPLRGLVGRVPAVDPYAVSYDDSDSRAVCLGLPRLPAVWRSRHLRGLSLSSRRVYLGALVAPAGRGLRPGGSRSSTFVSDTPISTRRFST